MDLGESEGGRRGLRGMDLGGSGGGSRGLRGMDLGPKRACRVGVNAREPQHPRKEVRLQTSDALNCPMIAHH
eukprot:1876108-Pyramimonas_sp.AAC.1